MRISEMLEIMCEAHIYAGGRNDGLSAKVHNVTTFAGLFVVVDRED